MRRFLTELRLQRPWSRRLGWVGLALAASAPPHLDVMTLTGGTLSGAVSFRKPITFALSFALLLWASGWVMDRLTPRRGVGGAIAGLLAGSAVVEVGSVTVQAWRGVPSHFNSATAFDAGVFSLMGATILASSLALVALAVWAVIDRPRDKGLRLGVLPAWRWCWPGSVSASGSLNLASTCSRARGESLTLCLLVSPGSPSSPMPSLSMVSSFSSSPGLG